MSLRNLARKLRVPATAALQQASSTRVSPAAGPRLLASRSSEGSRGFASEVAKPTGKQIKVPEALYGGTGNYASALFLTAAKANLLDNVESEIKTVVEASKKSPMFSQFIKDLSVPKETRVKAITEIFAEAGFSDVTKNFLAVLADNGRLKYTERIAERFVDLTMAHKGEVKVVVRTVIPLPEKEEKELKETLQDILGKNKTILVEQKIDYSIMGGLVIEFGQKVFDMSIKTRAKQMETFLRQPLEF
ncbi:ATP synthase subunit O, mitochondrial-like [Phragmites australis]|uniref:ATP synthase subunit O, mitochondrial-like n=1 Tax=Phragmites australis TaxID=29695 RepID=UPI002D77AA7B|nr:ATP synthase subunit O, mitochondrial-like [Phragmites australis]